MRIYERQSDDYFQKQIFVLSNPTFEPDWVYLFFSLAKLKCGDDPFPD